MPASYDFELARFTPAEAEEITKVSTTLQRDWRRHGYLPSGIGHARFDVYGLAKLLFLSSMSARGIGPGMSSGYVDFVMNAIAWAALDTDGAVDGKSFSTQTLVIRTSPLGEKLSRVQPAPVLVIFADGSEHFDIDASAAIRRVKDRGEGHKLLGPVIVLDTRELGEAIAARAGRPLIRVITVEDGAAQ